jgi:hypothetical protein
LSKEAIAGDAEEDKF